MFYRFPLLFRTCFLSEKKMFLLPLLFFVFPKLMMLHKRIFFIYHSIFILFFVPSNFFVISFWWKTIRKNFVSEIFIFGYLTIFGWIFLITELNVGLERLFVEWLGTTVASSVKSFHGNFYRTDFKGIIISSWGFFMIFTLTKPKFSLRT